MNQTTTATTLPQWTVIRSGNQQATVIHDDGDQATVWMNGAFARDIHLYQEFGAMRIVEEASEMPWHERVFRWFDDRNLTKGSTPEKQFGKLLEEMAELYQATQAGDQEETKDAIGDCLVVLAGMCRQLGCDWPQWERPSVNPKPYCVNELIVSIAGMPMRPVWRSAGTFGFPCQSSCVLLEQVALASDLSVQECMEHAWNEIKNRPGYLDPRTGVFVKNAEMPEELKQWMVENPQ